MLLHWTLAGIVVVVLGLALFAAVLPTPPPSALAVLRGWHQGLGLLAWAIGIGFALWRLRGRTPRPDPGLFAWQRTALAVMRAVLHGLVLVVPPFGYLAASVRGPWIRLFTGSFVPGLAISPGAADFILIAHRGLAWALLAALAVHIGIVLYHHLVARDRVLRRMLPK